MAQSTPNRSNMQTRGRRRVQEENKAQLVELAEASKAALQGLTAVICQRNRLNQQAQRALARKNEVMRQLDQFVTEQQGPSEGGDQDAQNVDNQEHNHATIERLEKQLRDQKAEFEQERTRLQQQTTISLTAQRNLNSSLSRVLPQLRGLLEAHDREQWGATSGQLVDLTREVAPATTSHNQEVTRRLSELQNKFDEERAQLLEQVSEAANTQRDIDRRNLTEREAALTCPISLDLFENPVVTECCGKTFSSNALSQALSRNAQCPVCRAYRVSSHASRDMANLVELHRTERSLLGLPENSTPATAVIATDVTESVMVEENATEADRTQHNDQSNTASNARQNQNRNQRSERVQARSAVPRRQDSRQSGSTVSIDRGGPTSRGRRRGGRRAFARGRRPSRASDSSASTAASNSNSREASDRSVSRTGSTTNAAVDASSFVSSPPWMQLVGSSLAPPSGGYRTGLSTLPAWMTRSIEVPTQSSYGCPPTDESLQFNPCAHYGYFGYGYGSDSD